MYAVRAVGTKGQVVIPEALRRDLGIKPGTNLLFDRREDGGFFKLVAKPSDFVEHFCSVVKKKVNNLDLHRLHEQEMAERVSI